ncbi:MAG: HK97-gp10 family putative phage morphogenesis protein [Candidatus Bathyarchaeaceae archaeon]
MAVEMEMNLEGFPELRDKLNRLDDGMKRNVQDAMRFEAEVMKNTARAGCPVRTGRLRDSIFAKVEGWMVKLGATAAYAVYQEFGTRRIQPRRFLSNAVEAHMHSLINRINQAVGQAIGEASTR